MLRQKNFYKALFLSCSESDKKLILDLFKKIRKRENNVCYCGHTDTCDCGSPGEYELISALDIGGIDEKFLDILFEEYTDMKNKNTLYKIRKDIRNANIQRKEECINDTINLAKKVYKTIRHKNDQNG